VKFGISFTLTFLNQAGALVHVYADGSVQLNHGGTEMGQGLNTKVAQVAARVFGLEVEAVKITATDTGKVPNTSATAASSGADLNGMACKDACDKIKARLVAFAAEKWGGEVVFADGQVLVGTRSMSFAALVSAAYMARISLSATGFYKTPKVQWDRLEGKGRPFLYFAYGAAVSEVELDTLTGENRILRTDILHDVGNSLNSALDIGQVEGAFVQGAGWLTIEELRWAEDGRLLTAAPATYKIPCASDAPDQFNVALWDGANLEKTIYRSKAVGEPPFVHGMSVFMALRDAVKAGGGDVAFDAPATAERLLMALQS
jgi:xanthine dehydrogenase large subunit